MDVKGANTENIGFGKKIIKEKVVWHYNNRKICWYLADIFLRKYGMGIGEKCKRKKLQKVHEDIQEDNIEQKMNTAIICITNKWWNKMKRCKRFI